LSAGVSELEAQAKDKCLSLTTIEVIDDKYGLMGKVMGVLDVAVRNLCKSQERVGIEISLNDA
jgi:hypothetical protein